MAGTPAETLGDHSLHVNQYAVVLFEHIDAQNNRADTKSQLVLTADALLADALTIAPGRLWTSVTSGRAGILVLLRAIATIILFLSLMLSVYFSVLVALPTFSISRKDQPEGSNLFYFADIARVKRLDFIRRFVQQTDEAVSEALLEQAQVKSVIVSGKFKNMPLSSIFLLVAIVTGGLLQLINWLTG